MPIVSERWPRWRGDIRVVVRDARTGRFLPGGRAFHNLIVDLGLNLVRDGLIGVVTDTQIHYVALGTGCGTLATALTNGTPYTSLAMNAGIPQALPAGTTLTIMNGASQINATVATGGAALGATSIPVNSFTANANYAANTTSVTPVPASGDTGLHNEVFRKGVSNQNGNAGTGIATTTLYVGPQDINNVVIAEVGWFAGVRATSASGSGVLVARTLYNHQHTNLESVQISRQDTL